MWHRPKLIKKGCDKNLLNQKTKSNADYRSSAIIQGVAYALTLTSYACVVNFIHKSKATTVVILQGTLKTVSKTTAPCA